MARLLRARWGRDSSLIRQPPTPAERSLGALILLQAHSQKIIKEHEEGALTSLHTWMDRGVVWTRGRYTRRGLEEKLGVSEIPVLDPRSRLSELIMREAHERDHRHAPADTLARSRRTAWVVRGRNCAKKIVKTPVCTQKTLFDIKSLCTKYQLNWTLYA